MEFHGSGEKDEVLDVEGAVIEVPAEDEESVPEDEKVSSSSSSKTGEPDEKSEAEESQKSYHKVAMTLRSSVICEVNFEQSGESPAIPMDYINPFLEEQKRTIKEKLKSLTKVFKLDGKIITVVEAHLATLMMHLQVPVSLL